ncbi:unannotated protein [freshwater metagenome]|uniref:Unannotated protein n=1 Tax=freshwater metagenome TaxID=449393 RepID=A0A6J6IN03_9ZZZZ|nr:hypothetical protein [Actinomycetota bacterium]
MSDSPIFQSRRERREAEKTVIATAASAPVSFSEPALTGPTPTLREPEIFLEPVKGADFGSTSNLGAEPVTASIIIDTVPDLENNQIVISGTGVVMTTGSIEITRANPTTGSIAVVSASRAADEAIVEDSLNSFVASVAPIRAAGIAKTRAKTVELTLVTRKGQGQVYGVMSTAVLMITIGSLVVAAFMLGILD